MKKLTISVVYQSGAGHTRVIAESLAKGCRQVPDVEVHVLEIKGTDVKDGRWSNDAIVKMLDESDAIAFGSATYMGSVSAIFKAFMETMSAKWMAQAWKDKVACGFTNSASQSGDKLSTLIQLAIFAAQLNMLWVGLGDGPGNNWSGGTVNDVNRLGSTFGLMAQSNFDQGPDLAPTKGDHTTAERFGRRFAEVTGKWNGREGYVTERKSVQ